LSIVDWVMPYNDPIRFRLLAVIVSTGLFLHVAAQLAGQSAAPLTLLSKEGRRTLATVAVNSREFVALDELASTFQLAIREEAGALTVSYRGRTIVLNPDQPLASSAGRLISLPAAPTRVGGRWLVPVEFISRALAPIYETRLDWRASSHLVVIGDLRVPRLTIRYEPLPNAARVTITAMPQTASTVTQDNSRVTIKFDADAVDAAIPAIPVQGASTIVQAIRGLDPPTLAIELGSRFSGFRASTENLDQSTRLVIDLVAAAPADTAAPAPPPPAPAGERPVFGQQVAAIRTIVIDAGHGGDDAGTKGANGTLEKDLALSVARRTKAVLESRLGARVLLTRDDDRQVPLDGRTAVANNNKADLFLSFHANGSLRPTTIGATIYVAAFSATDRAEAALTPARVPIFGGGSRDIELVPWDLAQIRHVEQSTELASLLRSEFASRIPLDARPVDFAPFRVLESANMPAALIEMGYLSNADQEKQMASAEFQATLVQAVADAVLRFRDYLSAGTGGDR
jgi:N-acetylmuramoyl-L-alanine amidase